MTDRRRLRLTTVLAATATLLLPAVGSAGERRIELRVGGAVVRGLLDSTVVLEHTPTMDYGLVSGTVTQDLPLRRETGAGAGLELDVPLNENGLGVQILAEWASTGVTGDPGTYGTRMQYETAFPPDYELRVIDVDSTSDWPAATGTARTLAVAANLSWTRTAGDGRWRWGASAGLAVLRTKARVESLGHSSYQVGGHGVLFGSVAQVEFDAGPATGLGFDAGAFVDVEVSRRLSLRLDARWFGAGERDAEVSLLRVTNPGEIFLGLRDVPEISAARGPQTVPLDPSFLRASFSLGYRF